MFDANKAIENIVKGLKDSNQSNKAIIGISGGKDSTVVAYLAVKAYGKDNVIGVLIPNGVQSDINDAETVCNLLGIKSFNVNIGDVYNVLRYEIESVGKKATTQYETNTPARLRMTVLYGISAIYGGRVLNTCNLSEDVLGYSTLFGDTAGSYGPLCDYTVTEVIEIGKALGIPLNLIEKAPSDGMCGLTDEQNISKSLGIENFTYKKLDTLIRYGNTELTKDHDFDDEDIEKLVENYYKNKFKTEIIRMPHPKSGLPNWFERP